MTRRFGHTGSATSNSATTATMADGTLLSRDGSGGGLGVYGSAQACTRGKTSFLWCSVPMRTVSSRVTKRLWPHGYVRLLCDLSGR